MPPPLQRSSGKSPRSQATLKSSPAISRLPPPSRLSAQTSALPAAATSSSTAPGIGRIGKPLHEMPPEEFDAVFATNIRAPFLLMRAVIPQMIARGGGHIINISSLAGQGPLANGAAYAASKWALNGLSYSAAEELRGHNIRVSVIAPGSVNTDFGRGGKDRSKMLQAEDVANVTAMLVTQPPQSFISEVRMRPTQKP